MDNLIDVFAQNLTRYRVQKGLMQKELAERLKVSKATISCWESGTYSPKLSALYEICAVLDISLADLLGIDQFTVERYTQDETSLLEAYRAHPELQHAVRILLGLIDSNK